MLRKYSLFLIYFGSVAICQVVTPYYDFNQINLNPASLTLYPPSMIISIGQNQFSGEEKIGSVTRTKLDNGSHLNGKILSNGATTQWELDLSLARKEKYQLPSSTSSSTNEIEKQALNLNLGHKLSGVWSLGLSFQQKKSEQTISGAARSSSGYTTSNLELNSGQKTFGLGTVFLAFAPIYLGALGRYHQITESLSPEGRVIEYILGGAYVAKFSSSMLRTEISYSLADESIAVDGAKDKAFTHNKYSEMGLTAEWLFKFSGGFIGAFFDQVNLGYSRGQRENIGIKKSGIVSEEEQTAYWISVSTMSSRLVLSLINKELLINEGAGQWKYGETQFKLGFRF